MRAHDAPRVSAGDGQWYLNTIRRNSMWLEAMSREFMLAQLLNLFSNVVLFCSMTQISVEENYFIMEHWNML